MSYTPLKLNACTYAQIPCNTPVINKNTLEYYIWIGLPKSISSHIEIFEIYELLPTNEEVDWVRFIIRENCRPWLKIESAFLDTSVGQHLYKLSFVDTMTNDIISLYISYIIQDDNPDKPYIYMDRQIEPSINFDRKYEQVQ